jgi:DNA-directed RNA polymerase subunit RPC12/RpoP
MANCPYCSGKESWEGKVPMEYVSKSKVTGATRYHCHMCGQDFIKDKGAKKIRKGQF